MATVEVVGEPRYVLTLTKEEARTLLYITGSSIIGIGEKREHCDSIYHALSDTDLEDPNESEFKSTGTIRFEQ